MSESSYSAIQACLERLRSGDDKARADLIARACKRLEDLAHKALRSFPGVRRWEQTADVVQNACLRLHRALSKDIPSGVKEFFALAATLIRRELIDLLRHYYGPQGAGNKHASQAGMDPAARAWEEHVSAPADDSSELLNLASFHEAAERLPGPEREVFDLVWYQELGLAEVALLLGVSERTAKRRWREARLSLHAALAGNECANNNLPI
jgi:RNA polymerase sigma factor (sigma-70 family)